MEQCRSRLDGIALAVPELEELARRKGVARRQAAAPRRPPTPPPPVAAAPEPATLKKPALGLAAAVLAVSALAWWGSARWRAEGVDKTRQTLPLEQARVASLAAGPGVLYGIDPQRRLLLVFARDTGRTVALHRIDEGAPAGLAAAADGVWVSDAAGRIARYGLGAELAPLKAYANPETVPAALYWDGRHLWVRDARTETILQYAVGDALTLAGQHTVAGISPAALHVADGLLWALDAERRAVVRYKIGALLDAHDRLDLAPWLPAEGRLAGMAVQGDDLWLLTQAPDALHRLDLSRLRDRGAWKRGESLGLDIDHGPAAR